MTHPGTTVIWRQAPRWERAQLIAELRTALKGRVQAAWLVGSYAARTWQADSEVEFFMLWDTSRYWCAS